MRLLLDTHALLWFALGDARLPDRSRSLVADPGNEVFVSAASAWEIAAKYRKGKLPQGEYLILNWAAIVAELRLSELPITAAHALKSGLLEFGNSDPFDRMIVAQALIENLAVVSLETGWDGLGVIRIWT